MSFTLFAIQAFAPLPVAEPLWGHLQALVRGSKQSMSFSEQHAFYGNILRAMSDWSSHLSLGVWDYVEDSARAKAEYSQWRDGTVSDAEEAVSSGSIADPTGHMFVTLLFYMRRFGEADRWVNQLCRMPEEQYWTKNTFRALYNGLQSIDFSSIKGNAIFIRPGSTGCAVSGAELTDERYDYLMRLT